MSLENTHWPHQVFGTSGVVEIQRTHIKLACVLIGLETVSLVSTHTYPKWTSTHCVDHSLWKDSFGVRSPDPVRGLLLMLSCPSAEIPGLEIILKDRPQAIYFVQSVSCQRRWDEASPEPLGTRILTPSILLGIFSVQVRLI